LAPRVKADATLPRPPACCTAIPGRERINSTTLAGCRAAMSFESMIVTFGSSVLIAVESRVAVTTTLG
jgi:hypothetical protein